jgi:hypothetical protein
MSVDLQTHCVPCRTQYGALSPHPVGETSAQPETFVQAVQALPGVATSPGRAAEAADDDCSEADDRNEAAAFPALTLRVRSRQHAAITRFLGILL